jgi:hypothetical protein
MTLVGRLAIVAVALPWWTLVGQPLPPAVNRSAPAGCPPIMGA